MLLGGATMSKYPISSELFPFNHFVPPISSGFLRVASSYMNVPRKFLKAGGVSVVKHSASSYDGAQINYYTITPENIIPNSPCLFYIHGGGFVLKAAGYHYRNCLRYAKEAGCIVVFPDYRLAPEYPFPIFYEDCYAVFCEIYEKAADYGIDRERIGIGGDSAGATLAAGLCMMADERNHPVRFVFQMLAYPYLDARSSSKSYKLYTDTPMWNSTLSARITPMTKVDKNHPSYFWYSPVETDDFTIFPPAYIETAEFDCLHDDGILFAEKLRLAGISVQLNETKGTMHGYDIVVGASVTLDSMKKRINFMQKNFEAKHTQQ